MSIQFRELLSRCIEYFELIDWESEYDSLENALADIYDDDNYTADVYRLVKNFSPDNSKSIFQVLFGDIKAWFDCIDYEEAGYQGIEEAIDEIHDDEGFALGLYRDLTQAITE